MVSAAPGQPDLLSGPRRGIGGHDARDWDLKRSGAGYVTRFQVRRSFLDLYKARQVGGQTILLEYSIPAKDLAALNASVVGTIAVVAACHLPHTQSGMSGRAENAN